MTPDFIGNEVMVEVCQREDRVEIFSEQKSGTEPFHECSFTLDRRVITKAYTTELMQYFGWERSGKWETRRLTSVPKSRQRVVWCAPFRRRVERVKPRLRVVG